MGSECGMNILFLTTSYPKPNDDTQGCFIKELATALSKKNKLTILTPDFDNGLLNELKKNKVQTIKKIIPFLIQIKKQSKRNKLIVCNWIITGLLAQLATHNKKIAIIVRGEDMKAIEDNNLIGKIFLHTLAKADLVCAVSTEFVEKLRRLGINAQFTPNGVNRKNFTSKQKARKLLGFKNDFFVLFVGSLIKRKGVEYLIQAMKNNKTQLRIVGDGEEKPKLMALAKKNKVNAIFMGTQPKKVTAKIVSACDIFVLPSLYEGRPNALMEAMVAGKPCIATRINGAQELITNCGSGYLVEKEDSKELNRRLTELINNKATRERFELNVKVDAKHKIPSWEKSASIYQKLFLGVMRGRN